MGRYDLAMYHAQNAVITIQSNLLFTFLPETKQNYNKKDGQDLKDEMKKEFKDKISILAVAYHNLAVQQEHLKLYAEALENYEQAANYSKKYFGTQNAIYLSLYKVYE